MRVVNFEMYHTTYGNSYYYVCPFFNSVRRPYRIVYQDTTAMLQRVYLQDTVDPSVLYYETVVEIDPNLFPAFVMDLCLFTLDVKVSDFKKISDKYHALSITDKYDIVYHTDKCTPLTLSERLSNLDRPIGVASFDSNFLMSLRGSEAPSIWELSHTPYENNRFKFNANDRAKWFPSFLISLIERYGIRKHDNPRVHLMGE